MAKTFETANVAVADTASEEPSTLQEQMHTLEVRLDDIIARLNVIMGEDDGEKLPAGSGLIAVLFRCIVLSEYVQKRTNRLGQIIGKLSDD